MKIAIDADSMIYVCANNAQKEEQFNKMNEIMILGKVDSMIKRIFKVTKATHYTGFYGASDRKNFRYDIAKTLPYKGKRPESQPYLKYWAPIIKKHMKEKWGFTDCGEIEADDAAVLMKPDWVVSPDKDLKQYSAWFFDYKTAKKDQMVVFVTPEQSKWNFFGQWITGDLAVDNVPGIFGWGKGKITKIIKPEMTWLQMYRAVINAYFDNMINLPRQKALDERIETYKKQAVKDWRANNKPPLKKDIKASLYEIATDDAIEDHNIEYEDKYTREQVYEYAIEQFHLIKMLRKPKYGFVKPEWIPVPKKVAKVEDKQLDMPKYEKTEEIDILMDL